MDGQDAASVVEVFLFVGFESDTVACLLVNAAADDSKGTSSDFK